MKALITGGAGFIGSHVVDALLRDGHDVSIVDNLATGRRENVAKGARLKVLDICHPGLKEVFDQERPDVVIHLAAQTVVRQSVEDPIFDGRQNILGSVNVFVLAMQHGVKKVIYASSGGAVYGDPDHLPVPESHPARPVSYYGVSKYAAEHYLQVLGRMEGLPYTILRYANVYGARQSPSGEAGVVSVFARQMIRGETPTIFGKGDKTRDYVHVYDIVAANLLAIGGPAGLYNIGTGVETSDRQMFDALASLLGYREEPHYAPPRQGEVYRTCLDCNRAAEALGWRPRLALRDGLSATIGYYRCLAER